MKLLAWLGAALVGLIGVGSAAWSPGQVGLLPLGNKIAYVVATVAAGLVYAGAVAVIRGRTVRHGLSLVLAVAGLLRAITFATPPLLSTDLFRYVWDGQVQAAGINPYRYVPADPALAFLRDRSDLPAHQPGRVRADHLPAAARSLFALLGAIAPTHHRAMKAGLLGFEPSAIGCSAGRCCRRAACRASAC